MSQDVTQPACCFIDEWEIIVLFHREPSRLMWRRRDHIPPQVGVELPSQIHLVHPVFPASLEVQAADQSHHGFGIGSFLQQLRNESSRVFRDELIDFFLSLEVI